MNTREDFNYDLLASKKFIFINDNRDVDLIEERNCLVT